MNQRLPITCLLAAFLLSLATGVHAQWTWLYPKPHGNHLSDVAFLTDNTAIAVGNIGTIMVTHDAGVTWTTSVQTNGIDTYLDAVARVDATTAVAVGDNIIMKTTDAGASWYSVPMGTTAYLVGVDFAGLTGVAVGTAILRTTDGGETWTPVAFPSDVTGVNDVDMVTPLIGHAAADYYTLKTIDGGVTWTITSFYFPGSLSAVSFADELNGVMTSMNVGFCITHDGGVTWSEEQPIMPPYTEASATAIDVKYRLPHTVLACVRETMCDIFGGGCSTSGNLYRSVDDGMFWTGYFTEGFMSGIDVNSAGVAILVGGNGVVHRWAPPGTLTQPAGTAVTGLDDPARVAFRNASEGIVLGSSTSLPGDPFANPWDNFNVVMRTSDGGTTWAYAYASWAFRSDIAYPPGSSDAFATVTQLSGNTRTSALLKSGDNGATWSPVWTTNTDMAFTGLEFSSATHGAAVGPAGYAAVIDGVTVTTQTIPAGIQNLAFADGSTAIAVGGGTTRIIRSTDGGTTWSPVASPLAATLRDVGFANATTGVIVGPGGSMLRTTDTGETWTTLSTPVTQTLSAVSFSGNYGMAVGDWPGVVIETADAGSTWSLLHPPIASRLSDVVVFGPSHAIIAGPDLTVLEYRNTIVPTLFSSFAVEPDVLSARLTWAVASDDELSAFTITRSSGAGARPSCRTWARRCDRTAMKDSSPARPTSTGSSPSTTTARTPSQCR